MSDRLAELRRQRALVQGHLNWLDREIAAAEQVDVTALPPSLAAPAAPPAPAPTWPAPPPLAEAAVPAPRLTATRPHLVPPTSLIGGAAQAEAIMEEYAVPADVRQDVRKGCMLYFALAFVLLFVGVGILWLIFRR